MQCKQITHLNILTNNSPNKFMIKCKLYGKNRQVCKGVENKKISTKNK